MTPANRPSDRDFELLSAYLDNELGISERAALEMRLLADPELASALESLKQTIQIVRLAPNLTPPRNFTLDPARYGRRAPWWSRFATFQLIGAIGSAAALLLIVFAFTLSGLNTAAPASAPAANVAVLVTQTLVTSPEEQPGKADKIDGSDKKNDSNAKDSVHQATALRAAEASPAVDSAAPAPQTGGSAEGGAASGFAAEPTATNIPTLLPTIRPLPTSVDILSQPSGTGGNGPASNSAAAGGAMQPQAPQGTSAPAMANAASAPSAADNGASASKRAQPTDTPTATATLTNTPTSTSTNTPTNTPTATATTIPPTVTLSAALDNTRVAAVPAAPETSQQAQNGLKDNQKTGNTNNVSSPSPSPLLSLSQLLLIAGIALGVFSAMLMGIGWLMARTGRNR